MLKTFLKQYLTLDETNSHPGDRMESKKRLIGEAAATQIVQWYTGSHPREIPAFLLHVDFARKKQTAEANGPFTDEELRRLIERSNYYAADTVFPLTAEFNDRNLGSVERWALTWVYVSYTEVENKMLFEQRGNAWVGGELMRMLSETWRFKHVVEETFCAALLISFAHAEVTSFGVSCRRFGETRKLVGCGSRDV